LRDIGKVVTALAARALHLTGQLDPDAKGVGIHWLMSLGLTDPDRIEATFRRWITAQGGDLAAFTERYKDYYAIGGMEIRARKDQTGYIDRIDAAALGRSLGALGAGREQADDVVDPEVGLLCHARLGSHVERGALLATLYPGRANPELASSIAREISAAFHFSADPPAHRRVILRTL